MEKCPDPNNGQPWSVKTARDNGESEASIKEKLVCKYHVDKSKYDVDELTEPKKELCARYILPAKTSKLDLFPSHSMFYACLFVR